MTLTDQRRLAEIRANVEKWRAQTDVEHWDAVFLLKIIDELVRRKAWTR